MTKMISKVERTQITLTRTLLATVVTLILSYLYVINSTAFNAAAQERYSDQVSSIQSTIGELELDYIEKNNQISQSLANEYNLVSMQQDAAIFVVKNPTEKLSFNE